MVDKEPKGPPVVFEDSEWLITLRPDRSCVLQFKVPGTIVKTLTFNYGDACDFLQTFPDQVNANEPDCAIAALARHLQYPINLLFEWSGVPMEVNDAAPIS